MSGGEGTGKKVGQILLWLLTIGVGLAMALAGASKFLASEMWVGAFEGWGYPGAFSYVIGVLEVLGAVAIFVPKYATYGAALIVVIMCGAAGTLLLNPGEMGPATPVANIVAFAIIAYARRGARWTPG
jgi:uncharacterized membrane protein YphA (DoxX/SURF4 family)